MRKFNQNLKQNFKKHLSILVILWYGRHKDKDTKFILHVKTYLKSSYTIKFTYLLDFFKLQISSKISQNIVF